MFGAKIENYTYIDGSHSVTVLIVCSKNFDDNI